MGTEQRCSLLPSLLASQPPDQSPKSLQRLGYGQLQSYLLRLQRLPVFRSMAKSCTAASRYCGIAVVPGLHDADQHALQLPAPALLLLSYSAERAHAVVAATTQQLLMSSCRLLPRVDCTTGMSCEKLLENVVSGKVQKWAPRECSEYEGGPGRSCAWADGCASQLPEGKCKAALLSKCIKSLLAPKGGRQCYGRGGSGVVSSAQLVMKHTTSVRTSSVNARTAVITRGTASIILTMDCTDFKTSEPFSIARGNVVHQVFMARHDIR